MFKVKIGCAPDIIKEIFEMIIKITTSDILFLIKRYKVRSVHNGIETASFIGPKTCDTLSNVYKHQPH